MKKLLTLFTLLLCVCSGAWADSVTFSGDELDKDAATKTKGQVTVVSATSTSSYQQWKDGSTKKNAQGVQVNNSADYSAPTVASGTGLQFSVPEGYVITGVSIIATTNSDTNTGQLVFLQWASAFDKTPDNFEQITVPNKGGASAPAAISPASLVSGARAFGLYKRIKVDNATTPTEIPSSSGSSWPSSATTFYVFSVTVEYEAAGVTEPTFSSATGSSLVKNSGNVTITGATGNTVYYKWSQTNNAYTDGATLAAAEEGHGTTTVNAAIPSTTGTWYLYAVAKDGDDYSDVVKATYTITNQTYTVTLNTNGGTINAGDVTEYEEGTGATLPTNVTKDCYTFAGWYDNSGLTGVAVTTISTEATGNKEYWAKWTPLYTTGTYTFENNATVGTETSKTVTTDALLYDAFRVDNMFFSDMTIQYEEGTYSGEGDDFKGWKIKTSGASIKLLVENDADVTFGVGNLSSGAKVSYTKQDGTPSNNNALVAKTDNVYSVKGGTIVTFVTDGASTVTLKKIEVGAPAAKFDVTYKANGSGEEDVVRNVSRVDENMFTYAGHSFTGWNTQADGKGTPYTVGAAVTSELTLFAQWEVIINDYSFTPATSGDAPSDDDEINTSTGGSMTKVGGTITYDPLGLFFQTNSSSVVNIELNNHRFKAGTIITGVLTNGGNISTGRGCKIKTKTGSDVSKDGAIWTWDPAGTNEEKTFSYTVQTGDGIIGTNSFRLGRVGNFYLKSLTVTNAELVSVPVKIGDAGYASFASTSALDFTDSGITAYIATANGTDNVTMTEIAKVPANTGVVLKGTEGTVNVPVLTGDADATTGNLLKPGEKTVTGDEATAGTIYAFGRKGGQVGFVKAHEGFTITADKAYLDLSGTSAKGADFLSFVFGDEGEETDGIKAVTTAVENGVRYNLAGQKVGADYKGIVIVNGKKVIIK